MSKETKVVSPGHAHCKGTASNLTVTIRSLVPGPDGPGLGTGIGDRVRITRCPEGFAYVGAEGEAVDIITGGVWVVELAHPIEVNGWHLGPGHRVAALAVEPA